MNFVLLSIGIWSLNLLWWAGMWKTFQKAGQPGWAAIIPVYWVYVLIKIGRKPGWWLLWFFVPIANIFVLIGVFQEVACRFQKGLGFALGMAFLPFIFFPILGFGSTQFQQASS